jgi:hypothetical protein
MCGSIGVSPPHGHGVLGGVELENSGHSKDCHHDDWNDAGDGEQECDYQNPGSSVIKLFTAVIYECS